MPQYHEWVCKRCGLNARDQAEFESMPCIEGGHGPGPDERATAEAVAKRVRGVRHFPRMTEPEGLACEGG